VTISSTRQPATSAVSNARRLDVLRDVTQIVAQLMIAIRQRANDRARNRFGVKLHVRERDGRIVGSVATSLSSHVSWTAGALDEKNLSRHARISDGPREFDDLGSVRPFHEDVGATPLRRSSFISNAIRCHRAPGRSLARKQPLPWRQNLPRYSRGIRARTYECLAPGLARR